MMENAGIRRIFNTITDAYDQCGFFDDTLPNGGPRPVESRRRRSADDKFFAAERRRIAREIENNGELDIFDQIFDFEADPVSQERGMLAPRLADEPNLAWKQIGTGFRKWILRYLAECYGEVCLKSYENIRN